MKLPSHILGMLLLASPLSSTAQVNSGSNGSDGALSPTSNLVIDMADHPDGIYYYTSVNIPQGVTVSFIPNAANTPVVWLVAGNCLISGSVRLGGEQPAVAVGGRGGPGGFRGGNGGTSRSAGQGPGGGNPGAGVAGEPSQRAGGNASYGAPGASTFLDPAFLTPPGDSYGTNFLVPLVGGSGGGGGVWPVGGGGGGGAILIACSQTIHLNGLIAADGGAVGDSAAGGGSGGAIRLVSSRLVGNGPVIASGGYSYAPAKSAGDGRVRFDVLETAFGGQITGSFSQGYQPIILPPANQAVSLGIETVAGTVVAVSPTGHLTSPDVIIPAHQQNPVPIVVRCTNIPLNTEVIVDVKSSNGTMVRATGLNITGTQSSSTATVNVAMPRGGGTIQAKAVSGLNLTASLDGKPRSMAETGWSADGERFAKVEVTASLGGGIQFTYLTESGKRYAQPTR